MTSVYLVHWHEAEAKERATTLRRAGYSVRYGWEDNGAPAREVKQKLPDALVIDLGRLPSHGRQMASWARQNKSSRCLPIVFIEGDPAKTARLKKDFPECVYTTWSRIESALKKAIAHPPVDVVAPQRADYSGTPLPKKLGVKAGSVLALVGAPKGFEATLTELPADVAIRKQARGKCDVIVLFTKSATELAKRFPAVHKVLAEGGGLWVAWPKKTSGLATDLTQAEVQRTGLDAGLVDNKICAIDETWSGLRFMRRRQR